MTKKSRIKPIILVIDDDPDILESYSMILKKNDFRVLAAKNGAEAVQAVERQKIDLAIIDYKLGNENGICVGDLLLDVQKDISLVLFTAFPSYDVAVESAKKGFTSFMDKAVPPAEMISKIREIMGIKNGKSEKEVNKKKELRFISICRHSLITEKLIEIGEDRLGFKNLGGFGYVDDIDKSNFIAEIDLAIICASCISLDSRDVYFALSRLFTRFPLAKFVISNNNFTLTEKADLLKAGIKGFFNSEMDSDQIEKGLEVVRDGGIWAERRVIVNAIQPDINYINNIITKFRDPYGLSAREKEVLKTVVLGLSNKDIGSRLYISEKTVKTHINRIFKKLGVNSRVKAVMKAINEKLV